MSQTLELTASLADELRHTLDQVISDMSTEIAATDNAGYRRGLEARRDRLGAVRSQLPTETASTT